MNVVDIARLEEKRISTSVGEVAKFKETVQGGAIACRGERGEWINCVYGLSFDEVIPVKEFKRIIEYYTSYGIEPRLELHPFVHPETILNCGEAGFRVGVFENVLYRLVKPDEVITPVHGFPEGVTYRVIDSNSDEEIRRHSEVSVSGFFEKPSEEVFETWKRVLKHPKVKGLVAECDGRVVGAGSVEVHDEISALISLSVLPEYQRRGIQQGLIAKRLEIAARAGVKVATIGSIPGAGTDRNVARMGFNIAYTKVIMRYPGEGLVGSPL